MILQVWSNRDWAVNAPDQIGQALACLIRCNPVEVIATLAFTIGIVGLVIWIRWDLSQPPDE